MVFRNPAKEFPEIALQPQIRNHNAQNHHSFATLQGKNIHSPFIIPKQTIDKEGRINEENNP